MAQVFIQQSPEGNEGRASTARVVSEARYAVQVATKAAAAAAGTAHDTTVTPVATGTYVQSRDTAVGGVDYVAFRS